MFRILEMKQQVFPVERVRSHAQPLHPAGSSLERVRCAGSAQSFATRTRQLRVPPPVLILTACVTYFVILVGKPLGFVDLVLVPEASGAQERACGGHHSSGAATSAVPRQYLGTAPVTGVAWWHEMDG